MKIAGHAVTRFFAHSFSKHFFCAVLGAVSFLCCAAHAAIIVDNSSGLGNGGIGHDFTEFVATENFTLSETTTLTSLRIWLFDPSGPLTDFSGTLGLSIYSNNAGPDILLGTQNISGLTTTDSGFVDNGSSEVGFVDLGLSGFTLSPDEYWLAIKEGNWGTGSDGSPVAWYYSNDALGDLTAYSNSNEADPNSGTWSDIGLPFVGGESEFAMLLEGTYASAIPEPSTILLFLSGLGLIWRQRRRG